MEGFTLNSRVELRHVQTLLEQVQRPCLHFLCEVGWFPGGLWKHGTLEKVGDEHMTTEVGNDLVTAASNGPEARGAEDS